jgi:hypothetical protein
MMSKDRLLWAAAFAGPLAWFGDLISSWMLTPGAYQHRPSLSIHVITVIAALVAAGAGVVAWQKRDQGTVARAALFLAMFSLLVILGMAVPKWMLAPGAEP